MTSIFIHKLSKQELLDIASKHGFSQLVSILNRGADETLILLDKSEAEAIYDLLVFHRSYLELFYPYFDDETTYYNPAHEDKVDDFIQTTWQKVLSSLNSKFGVKLPGDR